MNNEELAPHIKELKKVLGDKVTEEELARELDNYLNRHRVGIDSAMRGIINKYGGDSSAFVTGANVVKKIADLTGSEQSVDILAKAVFAEKKNIPSKNGGERTILSGILGDETATVSFTEWSGNKEIVKGKVYWFRNCYAKLWNNNVQINIGNNGRIEETDQDVEVVRRDFVPTNTVTKKIDDLDGTERSVNIKAKVMFSDFKEIPNKDGSTRTIISGILGDETATASFSLWNDKPVLEKGRVYNFKNCYTKLWNDTVQINIGNNGTVEETDETIDNVPGKQSTSSSIPTELKIGEVREGSGSVTVIGRITSVEVRDVRTKNGDKTVYSGTIVDDTGEIQFSAWNDFGLEENKSYRISKAYVRSWKGIPQLNMGDNTEVEAIDVVFDESKVSQGNERTAGDIAKNGGGLDVVVRGVIVDVRPGSGMVKRCPQCKRAVVNNECQAHGTVEPVPDLRMKIVIDDGTGSIATTLNREYTEKITGVSFDAASSLAKARGDDFVAKELGDKIYMKHLKVRGNAMIDEYGLKINAKEVSIDSVDAKKGAKKLLDEVEGML